jgi:hypothetical protein
MEEENVQGTWNKKRIIITVFLLILLIAGGIFLKIRILGTNPTPKEEQSVKGASIKNEDFGNNIKESVKEKIDSLKQEVSGLDIMEIASSSPQVQKIINDIKSLEQYPTNQIKEICRKVCGL